MKFGTVSKAAIVSCLALLGAAGATAAADLKVAVLKTANVLSLQHAVDAGYFRNEGLNVEVSTLNNGPAVASAVVSGSADIGFAAAVAVVSARANNQPVRFFSNLALETKTGNSIWLIAPERAGNIKVADLKGKTIAINAAGGQCELVVRTNLKAVGLAWEDVKPLVLPFPQIPAALQLGNADAGCVLEPFYSASRLSPEIKAQVLVPGTMPDMKDDYFGLMDGFFATDEWLKANTDSATKFAKAVARSNSDIMKDPSIMAALMEKQLGVKPEIAAAARINLDTRPGPVAEKDFQNLIDLMTAAGMLAGPVKASDLVFPVNY